MKLDDLKKLGLSTGDEICVKGDMTSYYNAGTESGFTIGIYKGHEEKDGIDYLLLDDERLIKMDLRDVRVVGSKEDEYFARLLYLGRVIASPEKAVDDAFCSGKFQLDDKGPKI
jgi:hypothetical protein